MSLSVADIFTEAKASFNRASGGERTEIVFLRAVNKALDELTAAGELSSALAHVTATDGLISGLDEQDSYILSAGMTYHMIQMGQMHLAGPTFFSFAAAEWDRVKGDFMMKQLKDDQAAEDEDGTPENDIIGLGYLGDQ